MPGRLVMEQHAVQGLDGPKKDRGHASEPLSEMRTNGDTGRALDQKHSNSLPNNSTPLSNGLNGTSHSAPPNGRDASPATDSLPPELEHWANTYVPMGKMLERIAQQCYNDLQETIDGMAEMTVQQSPPAVNGAAAHSLATTDSSTTSVDKKLKLMNFAQTQKDRFIKALVLSDWARNMDDMNKLIELRMWLQQQDDAASASADAIVRLKHNMIPAKMPNPNIDGALELLSTGKAPWMPDLGYIPPKPLTAHKLLKTLRDMNFTLSVRLNLHEDLPPHFCNYTIANGRATFAVPTEFEVDLAAADEDPESPFYFIDIRFLFSSAPQLPEGFMRSSLEIKVNEILATDGLRGCYAFLHGLVLTHKINILRRQAQQMARSRWSGCIHIEPVHRSLILQYWTGRAGGKNWIELGISSGALSTPRHGAGSAVPRLQMRWFREGQEVHDLAFQVDSANLSMERMLEQIISSHVVWRLTKIRDRLRALAPNHTSISIDLQTSTSDPCACLLQLRSDRLNPHLTLRVGPVNGEISLSPVSAFSIDAEQRLNGDPSIDAGQTMTKFYCKLLQDRIGKQAHRVGWITVATDKQDNLRKIFGEDVVRRSVFVREGWGKRCAIAVTINLAGEKWWTVQFDNSTSSRMIGSAQPLSLPASADTNRSTFLDLESKAIAQLSFLNITAQLRQSKIQYELRQAQPACAGGLTHAPMQTAVLAINFRDLVHPHGIRPSKGWKPWCLDALLLTHHGVDDSSSEEAKVVFVIKAVTTRRIASDLINFMKRDEGGEFDVGFSETGAFALRMVTSFGEALVPVLQTRLKRIEQLSSYIRILRKLKAEITYASVSRIVFTYHANPALSAEVLFPAKENDTAIQLRFQSAQSGKFGTNMNPHRRIQPLLQGLLRSHVHAGSETGNGEKHKQFAHMVVLLSLTLPLLRGLEMIESANPTAFNARASARAVGHYRLTYKHPLPSVVLSFELKRKDDRQMWLVRSAQRVEDQDLARSLGQLWRSSGEDWSGVGNGAVAGIDGIEDLLQRIDTAIRGMKTENGNDGMKVKEECNKHEIVILD